MALKLLLTVATVCLTLPGQLAAAQTQNFADEISQPNPQTLTHTHTLTLTLTTGEALAIAPAAARVSIEDEDSGERVNAFYSGNTITIALPGDESKHTYTVVVHVHGYKRAVLRHVSDSEQSQRLSLLLVPHHATLDMQNAHWQNLLRTNPELVSRLVCGNDSAQDCAGRYEDLLKKNPTRVAAMLNLASALEQINVAGRPAFSYFQAIPLETSLLFNDRFFAYVDEDLLLRLKVNTAKKSNTASADTRFARLHFFSILHRHATSSYKELELSKANLQLTFQEKNRRRINGVDCVQVDTDIDYYRRFSHGLREVIPNLVLHKRTSPLKVFQLRWNATRESQLKGSGIEDFSPLIALRAR